MKDTVQGNIALALLRCLSWAIVALVAAFFVFYIILRSLNLDSYKPEIERAFQVHTGLVLEIRGPIRFANPFRMTVQLDDAVILNPGKMAQDAPVAGVSNIRFTFKFLSILKKDFFPRQIEIQGAQLTLKQHQALSLITSAFKPVSASLAIHTIPQFGLIIKNSAITFNANTKATKTLTIQEANFSFDAAQKKLQLTLSADFKKRPFTVVSDLIYRDKILKMPYSIDVILTTPENQLNFKGQMNDQTTKFTGNVQVSGKDLSNVLGVFGLNILETGKYNLEANVVFQNEILSINILKSRILGGRILGTAIVRWDQSGTAFYDLDLRGLGLNAGDAFKAVKLSKQFSNGELFVHYQMKTKGYTGRELLANQDGILSLGIKNAQYSSTFLSLYTQRFFQLLSNRQSSQTININCLVWLVQCETGRCHTQDLVFTTPGANVIGEGDIDFKTNTIDMMVIPTAKFVNLNPLALPLTITGPLNSPSLSPAPSKITAEITDILFNMLSGRTFVYIWRDLQMVMAGDPYNLQTCINTVSNYHRQEEASLLHGL